MRLVRVAASLTGSSYDLDLAQSISFCRNRHNRKSLRQKPQGLLL